MLGAAGGAKTHTHPLSAAGNARISHSGTNIFQERVSVGTAWNYTVRAPGGGEIIATGGVGTATALAGSTDDGNALPPYLVLTPLIKA